MGGRRAWRTIRSPPTPQACTADAHPSPPSFAAMEIDVFAPLAATAVPPVQFPGPDGPAPPIAQSRVRRMRSVPLPDGNAMAIARLLQDHERRIWRVLRLFLLGQACSCSPFSKLDVDSASRRTLHGCGDGGHHRRRLSKRSQSSVVSTATLSCGEHGALATHRSVRQQPDSSLPQPPGSASSV